MATNRRARVQDGIASPQPQHEPKWSIALKNCSPQLFTISMDTGILSIILNLHPWRFSGQGVLSTILFVFNLVLFVLLSLVCIVRLLKHHRHVLSETFTNEEELSYLGAPPIAYLTIVAQVSLTCSTAWGSNWTVLAIVLWWIGVAWTVALTSFAIVVLAKRNLTSDRDTSPTILLPLIAVMTVGTTGGLVVNYSEDISPGAAIPIIVVAYMCLGYALLLSVPLYTYLLHKLMTVGFLPPAKLPSIIIAVGPMGQFATAIQTLSTAANTRGLFGSYNRGTWLMGQAASSVSATAVLLALFSLGFGFLWISVGWYVVVEALARKQLPFSLTWWSLIFPMGVYTTGLLNLSIAMNSDAFRGLVSALLILLFIIYFVNWGGTSYRIYQGTALGIPQQRLEEKQRAQNKKESMDRYVQRGEQSGNNV